MAGNKLVEEKKESRTDDLSSGVCCEREGGHESVYYVRQFFWGVPVKKKKSQEYKKNEKRWVEYKINKKIESQVQNKWEKWMMTWVGVYRHVYI